MLCRQPRLSVRPILAILCAIAATILFQPNPAHAQSLTAFTGNYTVAVEPSSLQQGQKLEELPLSGRVEILSLPMAGLGGFLLRGVELGMPNRGFRTLVDRTREMQFSPIYTANRGGDGQSVMRQFDVGLAKTEEAKSPTPGNRQVARPFRLREWRDGKSTLDISGELR
jgi:hypothetical protein